MENISALAAIKQLEQRIKAALAYIDVVALTLDQQQLIRELRSTITDVRLDIRDADYAETGEEYQRYACQAKKLLSKITGMILMISEFGVFGPVDIVEITAGLEIIGDKL